MMRELFEKLKKHLEQGEAAVLVTVIASSGSTPRGAGSRMLVDKEGLVCGTIGGGAVEYKAMGIAKEALEKKSSYTHGFTLTRNQVADIGMVCGGDVTVYFQYVDPEDGAFRAFLEQILEAFSQDEDSWLLLDITDETCWKMGLYRRGEALGMDLPEEMDKSFGVKALQREAGGRKYYVEPLVQAGTVYVFGGGHVAQELVPVLAHVGFRCVVMDDREEFANPQVFPQAKRTVVGDLERISDYVQITERDYVCVMTRGHQFDYYVQRQALAAKPRYIGVMGSRNKIKVTTEKLLADGFTLEEIQFCHMPIGTNILAQTPAEIAVSIAAEWIATRQCGQGSVFPKELREALRSGTGGVMVTVVKKSGSAPRDVGTRMLICSDGTTVGTIGGGLAEYQAVCQGRALLEHPRPMLVSYDMRSGEAGRSGMICGGTIEVLLEQVTK